MGRNFGRVLGRHSVLDLLAAVASDCFLHQDVVFNVRFLAIVLDDVLDLLEVVLDRDLLNDRLPGRPRDLVLILLLQELNLLVVNIFLLLFC